MERAAFATQGRVRSRTCACCNQFPQPAVSRAVERFASRSSAGFRRAWRLDNLAALYQRCWRWHTLEI